MRIVRSSSLAVAGATLALALSISPLTANAASTFLLQFGSHSSEQAARTQWDTLQRQYPDLLGNMNVRIAPVSGDYRTQASGVTNREAAQSTCNQLAQSNVECLVVETSMYQPEPTADDSNYAALAPIEENISVEMVSEGYEDVTFEGSTTLAPQPAIAANTQTAMQATAPKKEKSFRQTFLPWLSFGDDEEAPVETQPAPVPPAADPAQIRVTDAPAQRRAPQRIEQPAWPDNVDRAAAASMSESLPSQAALRPGETRVVPARAPRTLQAPQQTQQAMPQQQRAAPQPQLPVAEATTPAQLVNGGAKIEVAEAIQVPLSFGNVAPVPVNKPVGYGGFPSQPLPARALWVQLSHFDSKDSAMQYWRQLSASNPEMMRLLRVRIISPWRTPGSGLRRTASLRMGPFNEQNEINRLCGAAAKSGLRCTMVQEVGSSATANTVRTSPDAQAAHARRSAVNRNYSRTAGTAPAGMYWVQLGAFNSVAEAKKRWSNLQTTHSDALERMQPQISYPALSSSPTPVYHLRTGPFVNKTSAIGKCNHLQTRRVGCVVVQSR